MVQNMSHFICPSCAHRTPVFGSPKAITEACASRGIELLGDVPLDARICEDADRGKPTVVAESESERAKAFMTLAEKVATNVGL